MTRIILIASFLLAYSAASHAADLHVELQGGISGRLYTTVKFDGNPVYCFIDTGANRSALYSNSFSGKYKSVGTSMLAGASGQWIQADAITVGEIVIDSCISKGLEINRFPGGKAPDGSGGVAGIDCFQEQGFIIDIPGKKLICSDNSFPPGSMKGGRLVKNEHNFLLLNAKVGTKDVLGIIDTGAGLTTVDRSLLNKNAGQFTFVQKIKEVRDATNKTVSSVDLYMLKSAAVGEIEFHDLYVLVADISIISQVDKNIRLIIGYNMIAQYKWYFDVKNSAYRIIQ